MRESIGVVDRSEAASAAALSGPASGDVFREAARLHDAGQFAAAEVLLRDAIARDPTNSSLRNARGVMFAAMKRGPAPPAQPMASPLPLIVFHGDRDTTVAHANAACLIDQVLAAESPDRCGTTPPTVVTSSGQVPGGRAYTRTSYQSFTGVTFAECWTIHQGGHSWSGGVPHGSYTDPRGPNASAEFIRFFDQHPAHAPAR